MLTGARLSEVLHLRWGEIGELSENGATARLTDSKTGPRTIWLGPDAAQLVARLPRDGHAVRIFPEALTSDLLYRLWSDIREQAGLSGLRIHDCRHTWASQGLINGVGLPTVGRLLGHRRRRTTAIYAHLDDAALRDAAAQASLVIAGAMRYTAQPQSDNASGDSNDELLHRSQPEDEHVTHVQHPEHVPLDHTICELPTDASTGKAANPKIPADAGSLASPPAPNGAGPCASARRTWLTCRLFARRRGATPTPYEGLLYSAANPAGGFPRLMRGKDYAARDAGASTGVCLSGTARPLVSTTAPPPAREPPT